MESQRAFLQFCGSWVKKQAKFVNHYVRIV